MKDIHDHIQSRKQNISKGFGIDELSIIVPNDLEKGKAVPIGTIKTRPNGDFIKTAMGWKYHSKKSKSVAVGTKAKKASKKTSSKHIGDMSKTEKQKAAEKLGIDTKGKSDAQLNKEMVSKNIDKQINDFKSGKNKKVGTKLTSEIESYVDKNLKGDKTMQDVLKDYAISINSTISTQAINKLSYQYISQTRPYASQTDEHLGKMYESHMGTGHTPATKEFKEIHKELLRREKDPKSKYYLGE